GARDSSGNTTYKDVELIVLPEPPPGTPPLPIPPKPTLPAQPTNVTVTPLDGAVRIRWNAGGREVMITRSSSTTRSLSAIGDERVVYTGTGSSYTDRGLTNGVEYRYVVMAVDAAGNHSTGVAAVIVPRRNLLKSPKDGAKLRKAPQLIWIADAEAQYYNAQLMLNGKKVLSIWPVRPAYALKKSWKFEGRKYTLKPGVYTWFVWPGYGPRSDVNYGNLMGSRSFQIVR
ncbi:MAG TPA: fibronectin type III domain-containing protein, partial [Gaiellaceae bacterium]|nr:fibronectin type III domain-containing protein [Gaiellaceae bacterium]